MLSWYVLHVRTGTELEIRQELRRLRYTVAVPEETLPERKDGKWRDRQKILFPGYVFIKIDLSIRDYIKIRCIPGVIRFLGQALPEPLRENEGAYIEWLANGDTPLGMSELVYDVGGRVRVISGPLKGYEGTIVRINRRQRRAVLAIPLNHNLVDITLPIKVLGGGS